MTLATISSEELPLAMFLTNYREEANDMKDGEFGKILNNELGNLFKVSMNEQQLAWVFQTHIKILVSKRHSVNSIEALLFVSELNDCLDLDKFFTEHVEKGKTLRENDIFRMRHKYNETELLRAVESK
jgi:hypothetical protein